MGVLYYKVVWHPKKKNIEKITILKRSTPLEPFTTIETVQVIEAYSVEKKSIWKTTSIEEHQVDIEMFGKFIELTPISKKEYESMVLSITFAKGLIDHMTTRMIKHSKAI